jgi:hypothetical protein
MHPVVYSYIYRYVSSCMCMDSIGPFRSEVLDKITLRKGITENVGRRVGDFLQKFSLVSFQVKTNI